MAAVYLVVEDPADWVELAPGASVISFAAYLAEFPLRAAKSTRIINLCATDRYLSKGYYCSLLAEARGHRVIPSVNTLLDLGNEDLYLLRGKALPAKKPETVTEGERVRLRSFFGQCVRPEFHPITNTLFDRFACPILEVQLVWRGQWRVESIRAATPDELDEAETVQFRTALEKFTQGLWRQPRRHKSSRWDLAILVNPEEKLPPSNAQALARMQRAATKLGLATELIGPQDLARLPEFDALFIRETTEIDHHTYRFARRAELEGLVVIDDPTSILRCCNKVFLQDAFSNRKVPTPKTRIVSTSTEVEIERLQEEFGYPLVLKIPNSSFSLGVVKVENREELQTQLTTYLERSDLVLAQEYLFTEYDWRIGVLNHRPLYACRYYMARNHWQIYDHSSKDFDSGDFETLPTYEVPRPVLDAALKAAAIIGNGLYGIDLKQRGKRVYVIEVNDNPSLEHGIEDSFLGDELYMQLMAEFVRRLEERGR